ncbi:MAG: AAA family ATPase [Clostridiales bacterium]|nr:AAA family ATPase [Clostridiales bacterium]
MKIISIHAQSFGKLSGVNLALKDGVNVIQNVNGFGKTTMASFIRAMLYGFTYKTAGGVKDSSRFAPWQSSGLFGGSMTVEHDGQTLRIERFFGATAKNETLTVTNDKTGKPIDLGGLQPGEFLLGLTADSYDRSAYFPQEAVELSSNDNFDNRLGNLIQNGADDYDKIQEKLRAYKKNYRFERGNGGVIYELDCKRRELLQRQADEERAERRAAEIENTLNEIEQEKQTLLNQQEQYTVKQRQLQREVAASQASPEEQRAAERLAELEEKIRRIPPEFDRDVGRCESIANELANFKEEKFVKKISKWTLIWYAIPIIIGVVAAILGITGVVSQSFINEGISLIVSGVVVAVFGLVVDYLLWRKSRHNTTNAENKQKELLAQYFGIVRKYVYVDGEDLDTAKQRLWDAYKKYGEDVRERDTLRSVMKAPSADSQMTENALNDINRALNDLAERLNALSMQVGQLTTERKGLTFDSVSIQDELLNVAEQRKQAEFEYEVADTVSRLLAEAKDNLSSSYLPRLTSRCSELLSGITQSDYAVVIDRSFNVRIREEGQTRDMSAFSRGIREITLLCFRVALSELLYDGDIPFIIIDDAFVNFDESNFLRATRLLKQLSTHAQVVYFTCHDRLGELLK